MEKVNGILKKCKSLSKLRRSKSSADDVDDRQSRGGPRVEEEEDEEEEVLVFVGSSRRPYAVSPKHLNHPLLSTLLEKPKEGGCATVKCEVVLFDHLLWMLDNADLDDGGAGVEELAELYAY